MNKQKKINHKSKIFIYQITFFNYFSGVYKNNYIIFLALKKISFYFAALNSNIKIQFFFLLYNYFNLDQTFKKTKQMRLIRDLDYIILFIALVSVKQAYSTGISLI